MLSSHDQERFQQAFQENQEKIKQYDENSIDKSRAKWDEASALVAHINAGGRSIYDIYQAREMEANARTELDNAVKFSSHLQAAKRQREAEAKLESEKHKEQVQTAASEKAAFRIEARAKWLAAGGSEHSFGENFENLWTQEVVKRVGLSPSEQELVRLKLAQSGRYQA
jgi:hypothetical protein